MKSKYINPQMIISSIKAVDIITSSADPAPIKLGNGEYGIEDGFIS